MNFSRSEADVTAGWDDSPTNPLLSVCCIAYNHESYIKDSLEGFVNQETNFPFEIIVHDDASTDNTREILISFQRYYPSLVRLILRESNQFSMRRFDFINDIFDAARGKYIAICEGDDFWIDPHKLQRQVDFLEKNENYSMCIHNAKVFNCSTGNSDIFNSRKLPKKISVHDVVLRRWFSPTASFVFRNGNARLPTSINANGDIIILYQNAREGYVHYIDDIMSVYRLFSAGSLSEGASKQRAVLYKKKLNFLRYVDQSSGHKYILATLIARARVFFGLYLFRVKFGIKNFIVAPGSEP